MERPEFERLALSHLDAVHRMAMHLVNRRHEEAGDLVQETYLRAIRASAGFQERGAGMRAWLFTILHNVYYTKLRKQARAPKPVPGIYEATTTETIPSEPPPAWNLETLDWEHVDERLKHAIDNLSTDHRVVLLLWGVEQMKYREIADILEVPIGTIMSRLYRARKILADELQACRADLGVRDTAANTKH